MASITFEYDGQAEALQPRAVTGREALGEASRFDIELFGQATTSAPPRELVGKACKLTFDGPHGRRSVHGVIWQMTAVATAQGAPYRRFRAVMRSESHLLSLRRRSRVFREVSAPDLIAQVLDEGGIGGERYTAELASSYPTYPYVVQYDETDAAFVRRLCERDGLLTRLEARDGLDALVLFDRPGAAPEPLSEPLPLCDRAALSPDRVVAFDACAHRRRETGKVIERDHDHDNPAALIEGEAEAGADGERAVRYRAPDHARSCRAMGERARLWLESLRGEAATVEVSSNAVQIAPGTRFTLEPTGDYDGVSRPEGEHFALAVEHRWRFDEQAYVCRVRAVAAGVPYRLASTTPRPRIHGLHNAVVTGPPGEEIHCDELGRVRVHFDWDRERPADDTSSLPVRVMQPNLQGSLLIPRVGWEVWVAFEDGDPDRPYVLGRAYDSKHPPPAGLPENKTMTFLSTHSSPGKAGWNTISYEDAAGRQGLNVESNAHIDRSVANNANHKTGIDEQEKVVGSQTLTVGGNQNVTVNGDHVISVASQIIAVGGKHELLTPKAFDHHVGAQVVSAANLSEEVGSPGGALAEMGLAAVDALAGFLPEGPRGKAIGGLIKAATSGTKAALGGKDATSIALAATGGGLSGFAPKSTFGKVAHGAAKATVAGASATHEKGGASGAYAVAKSALGSIPDAGKLIDEGVAVAEGLGLGKLVESGDKGANEVIDSLAPGVAGGAAPAPAAGGGGKRVTKTGSAFLEGIGGAHNINTMTFKWSSKGASAVAIGGTHATVVGQMDLKTTGASGIKTGALVVISAAGIKRETTTCSTVAAGAFRSTSSAPTVLLAGGALSLKAGSLGMEAGKVIFKCGGSRVVVDGSGVTVSSPSVKFRSLVKSNEANQQ